MAKKRKAPVNVPEKYKGKHWASFNNPHDALNGLALASMSGEIDGSYIIMCTDRGGENDTHNVETATFASGSMKVFKPRDFIAYMLKALPDKDAQAVIAAVINMKIEEQEAKRKRGAKTAREWLEDFVPRDDDGGERKWN